MSEPDYCPVCRYDVGPGSHYHCPNCGEVCSMMGHGDGAGGYSCRHNERLAQRVAEAFNENE